MTTITMQRFEKWHGLGNDFILIEAAISVEQATMLCDRHRGIGADGVLSIHRQTDTTARMIVLNADGSRPEMCGNGLRCVAAYVATRAAANTSPDTVVIDTDAGPRHCQLQRLDHMRWQVTAAMGHAKLMGQLRYPPNGDHTFTLVDVGNPHAVTFTRYGDEPLDTWGPALQRQVSGGINVELCHLRDDGGIDVLVWERGVGRTQACGTGACAVAAAATALGHAPYGRAIEVHLPGGPLHVTVARDNLALMMRGPAQGVYWGEIGLPTGSSSA